MTYPEIYLSRPSIHLPGKRYHNEEVIAEIQENYAGAPEHWPIIEGAVRKVFARCNSEHRYIERDPAVRVGDIAALAAQACLDQAGISAEDLDLVIYGGVAREYFEPATAMEVAAKIGMEEIHAFDVTSACVGQLEAIHIASAYLGMYPEYRNALVVSGELTRQFLAYDVQSPDELEYKLAGLTIGNAAAAWVVGRNPYPGGSARLVAARNYSLPQHYGLCNAPIDGTFTSFSHELFKLNVHVPPELARIIERADWTPDQVDHFVFHQPSEVMNEKVLVDLGVDPARGMGTHHVYGNTVSTTVALNMHEMLKARTFSPGDRVIFSSAAAGFSMVSLAGVWSE